MTHPDGHAPEHAAAVKALLDLTGDTYFDTSAPPKDARPDVYGVFNVASPVPHRPPRLGGTGSGRLVTFTTRYFASLPDLVRQMQSNAMVHLLDVVPGVDGFNTTQIRWSSGAPVRQMEDTEPTRYGATDVWVFTSDPTGA